MTTDEALVEISYADIYRMSAEELRNELEKRRDGDIAVAMRETSEFLGEFYASGLHDD